MAHIDSALVTESAGKAFSALGVSVGLCLHPMASKLHLQAASNLNVTMTSLFLSLCCSQRDLSEFKTNLS